MDLSSSIRNIIHLNTHDPAIKDLLLNEFGSTEAVDKVNSIVSNIFVEINEKLDKLKQLHVSNTFLSQVKQQLDYFKLTFP